METKLQQSTSEPKAGRVAKPAPPPVDDVPALESFLACGDAPEAAAPLPAPVVAEAAPPARKPRGFAAMDRATVRELARRGAHASQAKGTAHKFTSDEARAAGQKGGSAPHRIRGRGKNARPGV
jgi:general stress protein YciG